jgi:hypothetical protein
MNANTQQVAQFQPAVETYGSKSLTAADVRAQVNLMQDVMAEVMKDGTHFGVIPGTKKPTLYKAGAEKVMSTFRLAADPEVTDLSHDGEIHYRVKVSILSTSGAFLGAGIGECSSGEDKYAWRAAVCKEEFDDTPENRRRIKYAKWNGKVEKKQQVRTNAADVSNTILKMAKKRGLIDGVLTVTAASDLFTQDIEDLPPEVVAEVMAQHPVETDEQIAARRKAVHDAALAKHADSVEFIKERIGEDDMEGADKEWRSIPHDDQMALWLASSKGGCFTTDERKALKEYAPTKTEGSQS